MRVLKFGGTSVGNSQVLRHGLRIIREAKTTCRPVVVVSAAAGVTDMLAEAADEAPHPRAQAERWKERIGARYRSLAADILTPEVLRENYEPTCRAYLSRFGDALTDRIPKASPVRDGVLATGERLMSPLMAAALTSADCRAEAVDGASLLQTCASHGSAKVKWAASRVKIRSWYSRYSNDVVPVVTGFIGSTAGGAITTLGRGGSDYTAALLARALYAERLERWTDVEALYSSDPAKNEDAQPLSRISLDEARDWTQDGELGLHPRTLDPLSEAGIPLHVRCTRRPSAPGTRIVPAASERSD